MKPLRNFLKAPLSLLLSLLLVAGFSMTAVASFSASETDELAEFDSIPVIQEQTAALTFIKRDVTVNGTPAKTGMTILNHSLFHTGTGSHAVVEMGALGRVEYGPRTETRLDMSPGRVESPLFKCGSITMVLPAGVAGHIRIVNPADVGVYEEDREIDVRVERGEVLVRYGNGKEAIVKAGEHKDYEEPKEVLAMGDVAFTVYCDESHYPLPLFIPLSALLIPAIKDADDEPPFLSTLQP
jgi:hypothetical protein